MKSEKIMIGGLAVLVSGIVLGILVAPDKGSITRRKIAEKMNSYAYGVMKISDNMLTEVVQRLDTMNERRTDISRHP